MNIMEKPLTELQKKFARHYVEAKYGHQHLSNTECAIKAGYSPDSAYQRAYELLNPRISPHVVSYIGKMQEDWKIKHNIDPDKHMARLNHLGRIAEDNKMIGVSLRAEELRGKVAGYYIDRQIIKNKDSLEDMSSEELDERMQKILTDYKHILIPEEDGYDVKPKRNGKINIRTKRGD
jgi:phage terminase small subunit